MKKGDVLGHEFMGEVVEIGSGVEQPGHRRPGRRTVPDRLRRTAWPARTRLYSLCENSNPNAGIAEKVYGYSPAGLFGFSHMLGGYAGRAGGVRAGALRRCRAAEGRRRPDRRAGAVPVRHLPDRFHGVRRCAGSSPVT
ncbi:MAG: alcohol dehydrogenase catalytic domain-containing protein [Geodermatophilaceae bacterium]